MYEEGTQFVAPITGSPKEPNSKYAHDVRNQAAVLALEGIITVHDGVTNDDAARLFAAHEIYVNLTPSGSFDKTIGEAMAAGAIVVAMNDAVRSVVPREVFVTDESDEAAARALTAALNMDESERARVRSISRRYIHEEHSLAKLVAKLMPLLG